MRQYRKTVLNLAQVAKFSFLCTLLAAYTVAANAQNCQLFGYVTDGSTKEPLIGASVYVLDTGQGVITNDAGYYRLGLPCGRAYRVVFHQIGFMPDTLTIALNQDKSHHVALSVWTLATVEVRARADSWRLPGQINIPVQELERIPVLLGEPDLIKSLHLLPGFAPTAEGTSGITARGGSADQNLILLDGSTVYNSGHIFGFISTFHPGVTKQVDTYKSFFPARFGGRLSSVIDVSMKDGNGTTLRREANLGLINSSLLFEGPLPNERGSFLLAGRMAHSGILTLATLPNYFSGRSLLFAGMYDFNAKISWKLKRDAKLSISTFAGDDFWGSRVKQVGEFNDALLNWGNRALNLRYTRPRGRRGFVNTSAHYNTFGNVFKASLSNVSNGQLLGQVKNKARISELSLRHEYTWQFSRHHLTLGAQGILQTNNPTQTEIIGEDAQTQRFDGGLIRSLSTGAYIEDTWSIGNALDVTVGNRLSIYTAQFIVFPQMEPRMAISWQQGKQTWQLSYSKMVQPLHRAGVRGGDNSLFYEYWLPAIDRARPQVGRTYAARVARPWASGQWSVEAFWRQMSGQIEQKNTSTLLGIGNDQSDWARDIYRGGKGRAYGVELWVEKRLGRLVGWLGYTYSRSERRFREINQGNWFPFDFDRPHDVELSLQYNWKPRWQFAANFVYQTGIPANVPQTIVRTIDNQVNFVFLERNNGRLPDYHRLDVQAVRHFTTKRKQRPAKLIFGCYNAYGRANPVAMSFKTTSTNPTQPDAIRVELLSIFQFIPAINYQVSW